MSRINEIERKIKEMEGGKFQKLCNAILRKNNPGCNITEYGSQNGTDKTKKGTPDAYFQKEDGKIVCVEYTTEQTRVYNKINKDLDKCILLADKCCKGNEIDEIIYYYNSSSITVEQFSKLANKCKVKNIRFQLKCIDDIAGEIQYYPSIANEYLGIQFSTNQIFDLEDFIKEYDDDKNIAPLNMQFLFREKEKKDIINKINDNDFVMLYGSAGVGKTRLALEIVKEFENMGYKTICIKNKGLPLDEDLRYFLEQANNKYVIFVDDINEVNNFDCLFKYVKSPKYEVKIIATVRQYAFNDVSKKVHAQCNDINIEIGPVTQDEIGEFLKKVFGIQNFHYIDKIKSISNGNLRIAYMAGKIAIDKQTLTSISSANQIYNEYYSRYFSGIVKTDKDSIITLLSISILDRINLKDESKMQFICNKFDIKVDNYKIIINDYNYKEILDIVYDKYVRFSDQCFKNYVLYFALFKAKSVRLSKILDVFFAERKKEVVEAVNTLINVFTEVEVLEYIKSEVESALVLFRTRQEYNDFVEIFQEFIPIEAFSISKSIIDSTLEKEIGKIEETKIYAYERKKHPALKYLCIFDNEHIYDVLDLFLIYANKSEENCLFCAKWLEEVHGLRYDSINKEISIAKMYKKLDKSKMANLYLIYKRVIYSLKMEFSSTRVSVDNLSVLNFKIKNNEEVRIYRKLYWELLDELIRNDVYIKEITRFILEYSMMVCNIEYDKNIIEYDKEFIVKTIKNASIEDIVKYDIYKNLIRAYNEHNIKYDILEYDTLVNSESIKFYSMLTEKNIEIPYLENDMQIKVKIKGYIKNTSVKDILAKLNDINTIYKKYFDSSNLLHAESLIIDELLQSKNNVKDLIKIIIANRFELNVSVSCIIAEALRIYSPSELFNKLYKNNYSQRDDCIYFFTYFVEEINITQDMCECIKVVIENEISNNNCKNRHLFVLKKLLKFDNAILVNITRKILSESEKHNDLLFRYFFSIFSDRNITINELFSWYKQDTRVLKEVYFKATKLSDSIDYDYEFLLSAIHNDNSWLESFIIEIVKNPGVYLVDNEKSNRVKVLWGLENYIEVFDRIYYDGFCNYINKEPLIGNMSFISFAMSQKTQFESCNNWICHLVEKCNCIDDWENLFKLVLNVNNTAKLRIIKKMIEVQVAVDIFKSFPFDARSFSVFGSKASLFKERIAFFEEITEMLNGIEFIEHKKYINDRITYLKKDIELVQDREYSLGII